MLCVVNETDPLPLAHTAISDGPDQGLVAVGWDMAPGRLLEAYAKGIFPWTFDPVTWWSPDPRAILEPSDFRINRSLKKWIKKNPYEIRINTDFTGVMQACATPAPGREQTWISPEFIDAYTQLHKMGKAHSVECWRENELVGGVYGVSLGGYFCGESMFHKESNASKIALWALCEIMLTLDMRLFDIQMLTPVTESLGGIEIDRDLFMRQLSAEIQRPIDFGKATNFHLIPEQSRLV